MRKTFKYKAEANKATEKNALDWLQKCRILYNLCLEQRKLAYNQFYKSLSLYDQQNELPALKKFYPEFRIVNSQCLQNVVIVLDKAFKSFFRRIKQNEKPGFPRFKPATRFKSFTLTQTGWKLEGRNLYIKNVGRFKLFLSRPIEGRIKTVTIKRASTGEWFITFSCDDIPTDPLPATGKQIGIDVGLTSFLTDSNGNKINNPKYFRQEEKNLRKKQRKLSRRKKTSTCRKKAKVLVAKNHQKVMNQRLDFLHKTANQYINQFDLIAIEKLQIKNMVKNKHLSKSISDAGWNTFGYFLTYKAESANRKIVKVNPNGTSQECSGCGSIVKKSLSVRMHICPSCSLVMDRDQNAAKNILQRGGRADPWSANVSGYAMRSFRIP